MPTRRSVPDREVPALFAYLNCFSGLSGDMMLGALIDLGVPVGWLDDQLKSFSISGFTLHTSPTFRHGIRAVKLDVEVHDNSSIRRFADIRALIDRSPMSPGVKASSLKIFDRIADAESVLHGCPKEQLHFHEIGSVDSLVDVVGTCLGLEYLGVQEISASRIPLGNGWVDCAHGRLPLPAPATLEILTGVPIYQTDIPYELTTPTGAAILVSLSDHFGPMPEMTVDKIGYGAGTRDLEAVPNLLRVALGRRSSPVQRIEDRVIVAECTIDDMNPELFGHLMERLFQDGALDVYWIPVFMKKNRPGTWVQVLCREDRREAVLERILTETTSIGVRYSEVRRWTLPREPVIIETEFGSLLAKRIRSLNGKWRVVPEYDACRKIAAERGIPLHIVYEAVSAAGRRLTDPDSVNP